MIRKKRNLFVRERWHESQFKVGSSRGFRLSNALLWLRHNSEACFSRTFEPFLVSFLFFIELSIRSLMKDARKQSRLVCSYGFLVECRL